MTVIRALLYAGYVTASLLDETLDFFAEPGPPMPSAVYANEDVDPTKTIGIAVVPVGDRPASYLPTFDLVTDKISLLHPTKEGA